MILTEIAGHRAWRILPLCALAAGINTSVLLGLLFWHAATRHASIPALTVMLVGWLGVSTYLVFVDVRTRCTHFELSLPVRTRDLWLQNLAAILTGGMVIVGITVGVFALHSARPTGVAVEAGGGFLALGLAPGLVLATLLLRAPRPSLCRIPITPGQVAWTAVVLAGTAVLLSLAAVAGWPGLALLLILTAVVVVWSYRSVPSAYSLAPAEPESAQRPDPVSYATDGRSSTLRLLLTIARSVSAGPKELLAAPFVLLFGLLLGGGVLALEGGRELRFLYLPMATYMLLAMVGPRLASLHHVDALPIARRQLIALLVLPYFLMLCAGYGLGVIVASGATSRLEYVNLEEREGGYEVTVPLRVYAVVREGEVPVVVSPWGESHAPTARKPFRWSRSVAYSPYSAPPGSSRRFAALQISRAAEVVYGVSISPETIEERYLSMSESGSALPRGEGLTLRVDDPTLKPLAGPMFPALVTLVVVPWLLLTALLLRAYRAGIRERVRQAIFWGSLAVLLGLMVGTSVATMLGFLEPWAVRAALEIPVMRAGRTMWGTLSVWLSSLLMIAGAYWTAHAQFQRMEIPTKPSVYTLICRPRD